MLFEIVYKSLYCSAVCSEILFWSSGGIYLIFSGIMLLTTMYVISMTLVSSTITIRLNYSEKTRPVPYWMRNLILCKMAMILGIGGSRGGREGRTPPPWASKFFRFHAVFGKIWRVHAPPGGFTPPPRENPGSATAG